MLTEFCNYPKIKPIPFKPLNFPVMVIAHRGFSYIAPENTIESFQRAIDIGVDMIELDIHLTKDNEIVVIHDDTVNRTTNGKGYVKDLTLNELKKLDAGSWFDPNFSVEKIPTLEEVLKISYNKVMVNIEIKKSLHTNNNGIEELTLKLVDKYDMTKHVLFSSFNKESLKIIKEINPSVPVFILYRQRARKKIAEICSSIMADGFTNTRFFINKKVIKQAHLNDLSINAYVVNTRSSMKKLIKYGIDGIITDRPDVLIDVLRRKYDRKFRREQKLKKKKL